jgi:hypothetical protein
MGTLILLAAMALEQWVENTRVLAPGAIEEPCFPMRKGDRLEYAFNSAAPLDYNLHYHAEGVVFPVDLKAVSRHEGQYFAPLEHSYCLMWTNKQAAPVELRYRYRVSSDERH